MKVICAYLTLLGSVVSVLALTETVDVVPYELLWLSILWLSEALRKLFKLNAEAVALILHELDFWVPFTTMCLACLCGSASLGHDGAFNLFAVAFALQYTVNVLFGKPVQHVR